MKVGDKVRSLITVQGCRTEGEVYEITDIDSVHGDTFYHYRNDKEEGATDRPETFELVSPEVLELDVFITKYAALEGEGCGEYFFKEERGYEEHLLKAKLIVEKPEEKKVEITAKQLEDAVKKYKNSFRKANDIGEYLKKELGL